MATEISFTSEEWTIIRSAPHIVSMAVAGAGGGILGAIKEAMAGGQAMLESAQSRSPIVQKLCTGEEIQAGQQEVQQIIMQDPSNGTPEKLKALAVQFAAQAADILARKAASEVDDYATLVMTVADTVSQAAKEGGFLGFGGELVSEGERDVMAAVQTALQGRNGSSGGFALPFPPQQPSQQEEPSQAPSLRVPQAPSQQPSQPGGPLGSSRSAGLPGLEPKSTTPPATTPPASQPKSSQTTPASPKSSTPKSSTPKSSSQTGASSKSGLSGKSKSKGGFRTGSGLKKSGQ